MVPRKSSAKPLGEKKRSKKARPVKRTTLKDRVLELETKLDTAQKAIGYLAGKLEKNTAKCKRIQQAMRILL